MKRNLIFILVTLLPIVANATIVPNRFIYVTGANGKAGSVAELALNLHNNNPISSWTCDLVLPEGVTFKGISPIKDRFPEGYEAEVTTEVKENSSIFIRWEGTEDIGMTGTDGAIATVTVEIADTVSSGKHMVYVLYMQFIQSNGNTYGKGYTEFNWQIMGSSHPFVEEGKVWNMQCQRIYVPGVYPDYDFNYFIKGDTLISGINYKKLYAYNENNDGQTQYKMALSESKGKVFFVPGGSTESYILYDFLIHEGASTVTADNIHPEWEIEMRNNKDKLIEINDVSRHCLLVNRVDASYEDYPSGWWIEGIGSELGPLNTWGFEANGNSRYFVNCEVNGQEIFNLSDFYSKLKEPDYDFTKKYYPKGTKWTEIRLDTLKYDSWYSKVGDEWVPNFETVEYYVRHDGYDWWYSIDNFMNFDYVYTSGPNWTDSLALTISEEHTESDTYINASIEIRKDKDWSEYVGFGQAYQFNWLVGKELYYQDMTVDELVYPDMVSEELHSRKKIGYDEPDYPSGSRHPYGTIEEIKEGDFGGVRPLKYVDLDGVRIVQGIGVTEWNDGECLFGPLKLYANSYYFQGTPPERHYRSMLVHFERDGEVLYNVWPEKEVIDAKPVTYTKDQMATIILPTAPDASKGKYYRLDRVENGQIVFEQEKQPRARVPYIIVPSEDFSIDISSLDLEGLQADTVTVGGVSFIGSYVRKELPALTGGDGGGSLYYDIIDTTPDCGFLSTAETGKEAFRIGALRAYLTVNWDDPYNHHGSKSPEDKLDIVLKDDGTGIEQIQSSKFKIQNDGEEVNGKWSNGKCYDLSGRKWSMINGQCSMPKGIYIQNSRKLVK